MYPKAVLIGLVCLGLGAGPMACSGNRGHDGSPVVRSVADAREAVAALADSRFDEAEKLAGALLAKDDRNAQAHLVAALTRYKRAMHQLTTDLIAIGAGAIARGLNHKYLEFSLAAAEVELAAIDAHLAAAARDPEVVMEQCLACWKVDWNRSGKVDRRDERLFEIEMDAQGERIPEDDPRRRPIFRFDWGDVHWARAMLAFQRAGLQVVAAYTYPEPRQVFEIAQSRNPAEQRVVIKLKDPSKIQHARSLLLDGLNYSDRSRRAYLAEKDDDREWVPNPNQRNHPLPLPVDQALFQTWEGVLSDLRKLIEGQEGLSVVEMAQLGDHRWADPPGGFVDVGQLLANPRDIVIDLGNAERLDDNHTRANVEAVLSDIFGDKYKPQMKASGLIARLSRMKSEIEKGEESMERKLRYLLWIN
jgi:hypothetical protein